jgi:hypothetical protein
MKKNNKKNSGNQPVTQKVLQAELQKGRTSTEGKFRRELQKGLTSTEERLRSEIKSSQAQLRIDLLQDMQTTIVPIIRQEFEVCRNLAADYTDRAIARLENKMDKQFNETMTTMDAFVKRVETNGQEVLMLGAQHDRLAKHCKEKIGFKM